MTPLAQRIVKELTLPVKRRTLDDRCGLLSRMDDVHCFECSSILPMCETLGSDMSRRQGLVGPLAFLPADRTWIEYQASGSQASGRIGFLLERAGDLADVRAATSNNRGRFWSRASVLRLPLVGHEDIGCRVHFARNDREAFDADGLAHLLYALLAMINSPRVIGRRTHMPHAGLQRALAKSRGMIGKFPLRAWTEIKLEVGRPRDESADDPEEIWLTGNRALHFVRAHVRIVGGELVYVGSYWRGDPALGIKQSRYKLVPSSI